MTSPSELSILRVYLPADLVDQLHGLALSTDQPVRRVVRGILELGMPVYLRRWAEQAVPVYDDELSDLPYTKQSATGPARERIRRRAYVQLHLPGTPDTLPYDEVRRADDRS